MKTESELKKLYHQIRKNPYLIRYIDESETVQLFGLVDDIINSYIEEYPVEFQRLSKYKEHIGLAAELKIHIDNLIQKRTEPEPKEYNSIVRARAFCIALLQKSDKENFLDGNKLMKTKIIQFTEETWKIKNGHTVYVECINIMSSKNPINAAYKSEHPKDFNFGKVLFDELAS